MAIAAAVAADWPRIMKTSSTRMLPNAMCEAETQTGTRRFSHCAFFGKNVEFLERLAPAGGKNAQQQFVLLCVVAVRFRKRNAVVRVIGEAHAIAVSLHPFVALAVNAGRIGADARQHARRRIAGHDVGADPFFEHS